MEVSELAALLKALAPGTPAGEILPDLKQRPFDASTRLQPIDAAAALEAIEKLGMPQIGIEEQDGRYYIIGPGYTWIIVYPTSPIFAALRERHARWVKDHH